MEHTRGREIPHQITHSSERWLTSRSWRIYKSCPYPAEQLESLATDTRDVGLWRACLDVMDEKADSIRLEPPGSEEQGFEFWITKEGIREFHQVKRQYYSGHWTLNTLAAEGVLTYFIRRLQDSSARCVFVSGNSSSQLDELSDRARRSASWEEFDEQFLSAAEWRKNFNCVRDALHDLPEHETYERLKRVRVETISESFLLTTIQSRAFTLVNGDAATVVDVLARDGFR